MRPHALAVTILVFLGLTLAWGTAAAQDCPYPDHPEWCQSNKERRRKRPTPIPPPTATPTATSTSTPTNTPTVTPSPTWTQTVIAAIPPIDDSPGESKLPAGIALPPSGGLWLGAALVGLLAGGLFLARRGGLVARNSGPPVSPLRARAAAPGPPNSPLDELATAPGPPNSPLDELATAPGPPNSPLDELATNPGPPNAPGSEIESAPGPPDEPAHSEGTPGPPNLELDVGDLSATAD